MGRIKKFSRDDVLERSIPVFWRQGFADTSVQDLEKATRVNKSGLYSEFEGKDDLYVESLRHYYKTRGARDILSATPLGWDNIERFLQIVQNGKWSTECRGCFSVNSYRDLAILPPQASETIQQHRATLKRLIMNNIQAEQTTMDSERIADIVQTFFSGLCIEQNLEEDFEASVRKTEDIMRLLRSL